jgi:hypothetical protein
MRRMLCCRVAKGLCKAEGSGGRTPQGPSELMVADMFCWFGYCMG